MFSSSIDKYNYKGKRQKRRLLITNFALYNLSTGNILKYILFIFNQNILIKRRIQIEKIKSISISSTSAEFVIHVPDEYDYRFSHPTLRDQIIFNIVKSHQKRLLGPNNKNNKSKYTFYFHEDINLTKYFTCEDHVDRKISLIPNKGQVLMSLDELRVSC